MHKPKLDIPQDYLCAISKNFVEVSEKKIFKKDLQTETKFLYDFYEFMMAYILGIFWHEKKHHLEHDEHLHQIWISNLNYFW